MLPAMDGRIVIIDSIDNDDKDFYYSYPWRFQWIIDSKLALMGWPKYPSHLHFLVRNGINHLVSLSPECRPPAQSCPEMNWKEISIEEFCPPTLKQINKFINFCELAREIDEPVGVCCRQGLGRSGTMAACYLVRFYGVTAERAITEIRKVRPYTIETSSQERAVQAYYDALCRSPPKDDCWQPKRK